MSLFVSGFLQVFFVAINAYCIAHGFLWDMLASSWCISYLWSSNVRKIASGGYADRLVYATGAAVGCVSGYLVITFLTGGVYGR